MDFKRWNEMSNLERFAYCADWARWHADKLMAAVEGKDLDMIRFEYSELDVYMKKLGQVIYDAERRLDYGERWDE